MNYIKKHIVKIKFKVFFFAVIAAYIANAQTLNDTKGDTHKTLKQAAQAIFNDWPVLTSYDEHHLAKIAMPIGGIGTGTVSLGGRGNLQDWAIMNTSGFGFIPVRERRGYTGPFFSLYTQTANGDKVSRILESSLDKSLYEGGYGVRVANHGYPRFETANFKAAYPFGQVELTDSQMPLNVRIKAFNPLIPGDANASGIPIAIITYELINPTNQEVKASVCGSMPNFIGMDGSKQKMNGRGEWVPVGAKENVNEFKKDKNAQGIIMTTNGTNKEDSTWGTIALTTSVKENITYRTSWSEDEWGNSRLDFWEDFSEDGKLESREATNEDRPMSSLAIETEIPAHSSKEVTFYLTWHFPNRKTWSPIEDDGISNTLTNYYATQYKDAWEVAEKTMPDIPALENKTKQFVSSFVSSALPEVVKEAALYNISTLRTQTCFRTNDGKFYGWEGTSSVGGSCFGSCTHVWNYDQATPFLFGELARSMREVEFAHATNDKGMMSFRVKLPLERANSFNRPAADGQMGTIMKMYREWQLSGDDALLKKLWPKVKKALEFCWIEGGWDANKDGVMEGAQHNTMDVHYFGPNPQMGIWYLGALRASEEMANYMTDRAFAKKCKGLYKKGSKWIDENLFNGEYYIHEIQPPKDPSEVASELLYGIEPVNFTKPDYQLGEGCLVDQLVGQFMSHICSLGYLTNEEHVKTTLKSIMKYNYRKGENITFNSMRSFVLGDEKSLQMASYPGDRPRHPFPYFTEAMTGFEYTAAIGMLYEGQIDNGLTCIKNIRDRYDGLKRNPFNEAECGNNYARAMASWGAVIALSGFNYSAVKKSMSFNTFNGSMFWSTGDAWGVCKQNNDVVELTVYHGIIKLNTFSIKEIKSNLLKEPIELKQGKTVVLNLK